MHEKGLKKPAAAALEHFKLPGSELIGQRANFWRPFRCALFSQKRNFSQKYQKVHKIQEIEIEKKFDIRFEKKSENF